MNNIWERKNNSIDNDNVFLCNTCNNWFPAFFFSNGKIILFGNSNLDNISEYLNNDIKRFGQRWSCDYCIYAFLDKNKLIIRDNSFNLIN